MVKGSGKKPIRLVITGASGFVASQIIPHLEKRAELILVARDEAELSGIYPDHKTGNYENFAQLANGADALLHLAVLNNNQDATLDEARAVNVDLLKDVMGKASAVGIGKFIYTSTTQALNAKQKTPYTITKREAEEWLLGEAELPVHILRLPAVQGTRFAGRWSFLNRFPVWFQQPVAMFLSALVPTVSASQVSGAVLAACENAKSEQRIVSDNKVNNWVFSFFKRLMDLGFAVAVLVLFWWLLLLIWLLVKFTTPGPGIFAQSRIGKHKKEFVCMKFRTMYLGTSQTGTHNIDVSAITPVGRLLRKTKLDELPQVWNILKNELSLVGPRPCLPIQKELIQERDKKDIFSIKPGITGLAQVQGVDMTDPVELACWDRRYLDLQTLVLDFKIVIRTAVGGGQGDKVRNS